MSDELKRELNERSARPTGRARIETSSLVDLDYIAKLRSARPTGRARIETFDCSKGY